MADLIKLKNSNPLVKYPVDAEQLNYNFEQLDGQAGGTSIRTVIESTGQTYSTLFEDQLAKAISQYALAAHIMTDTSSTTNRYVLGSLDGLSIPYKYTTGMIVSFYNERTNSGASTLCIGTLTPYPIYVNNADLRPGYMKTGEILSFQFMGDYWAPITYGGDSSGSSGTDGEAMVSLRSLIESAGITFDDTDTLQVNQAVASYVAGITYNSSYSDSIYYLTTNLVHTPIKAYFPGMTVVFVADADADTNTPAIKISTLSRVTIKNSFGNDLELGAIKAGQLCVCRYVNGSFRLISSYIPSFSMDGSRTITGISNDTSLSNDSANTLVTEHAVKTYVDKQAKGVDRNTVTDAYKDANGVQLIRVVGEHAIQLVTAPVDENGEYTKTTLETTSNSAANIFASSNTSHAVNAVSKVRGYYWETEKTGWAVDDVTRVLSGPEGAKQVVIEEDDDDLIYGVHFNHSPKQTEYFGFKNLAALPSYFRAKFTDSYHTPKTIVLEVNLSNSESTGTWLPLCYRTFEDGAYVADMSYGDLATADKDSDGAYVFNVPTYIFNGETITSFSPSGNFAIRMLFIEVETQYPTADVINSAGYDPNTDTTSEQYPIQLEDIGYSAEFPTVPEMTISYYDGTVESFGNKIYYTQYDEQDTTPSGLPTADLNTLSDGRYAVYITEGASQLHIVQRRYVYTQTTMPEASVTNVDGVWIDTTTYPYTTYVCEDSEDVETETITYDWVKTNLILLGEVNVASNAFTSNYFSYALGNTNMSIHQITTGAPITITVDHNFGSDVDIFCELVCLSDNNGYSEGDRIFMYPYMLETCSLDTSGTLPVLNKSTSYFSIASSPTTATITYGNLKIVHKTTGAFSAIDNGDWSMYVHIDKN